MSEKIYGIIFPFQKAQISAWCWGSCGYGQIGAIDIGPVHVIVCRQETCPHLDKQMDEPMAEFMGDDLYLRKLEDVNP
jgi:hypothetical protein